MSFKTKRILPEALNGDAVVPQAADNQFISEEIYVTSYKRGVSYQDEKIRPAKRAISHAELIRSLIYSSQVVINRAFLFNNIGLYHNFSAEPLNMENALASAALLREGVIVPFLFGSGTLDPDELNADGDFGKDNEGLAAYKNLVKLAEEATAVGFAPGDPAPALMQERFQNYLIGLRSRPEELMNVTASETLNPSLRGDQDTFKSFVRSMKALGNWADAKLMADEKVTRETFYADHLMAPESNVADGRFRKPDDPFAFVKKKIVDLRYNSNLPDAIRRFTFTPQGMPTRSALADEFINKSYGDEYVEQFLEKDIAAREFHANATKAMHLPQLNELTMADVYAIRKLDERIPFIDLQRKILQDPQQLGILTEQYQKAFGDFQEAISNWYSTTYPNRTLENRYQSFATIGIEFGGHVIILYAKSVYSPTGDLVGQAALHYAWNQISDTVKGISIKLLNKVYDHHKKRFDPNLSFSIEQMRSEMVYTKDEIRDILEGLGLPRENLELEAEQEQ